MTVQIGGYTLEDVRDHGAVPQIDDDDLEGNANNTAFVDAAQAVWDSRDTETPRNPGSIDGLYIPPGDWFGIRFITLPWWCVVYAMHARIFAQVNRTEGVSARPEFPPMFRYFSGGATAGRQWGAHPSQIGIQPVPTVWIGGELISDSRWTVNPDNGVHWPDSPGFNRQHNHGIHFEGTDSSGNSLCNVKIYGTKVRFTTGNAFYLRWGHLYAQDIECEECFRGLLSITDYTTAKVRGFRSIGKWGGIDVEPNHSHYSHLDISDGYVDNDWDIGLKAASVVTARRIVTTGVHEPFGAESQIYDHVRDYTRGAGLSVTMRSGCKILHESCRLTITKSFDGQRDDAHMRIIGTGGIATYRDVDFVAMSDASQLSIQCNSGTNGTVRFEGCTWNGSPLQTSHIDLFQGGRFTANVYVNDSKVTPSS
ncbi:MAG: hypothetical protein WDZ59_12590 [Pirellulales bacterium]